MSTTHLRLRVRRRDQPAVAPRYQVVLFSYRDADVIGIPREILGVDDEPVGGMVPTDIVREEGDVRARVVIYDPTIECTVQLFGWSSDRDDDPSTPFDERWELVGELREKKADITIAGQYPRAQPIAGGTR